MNVSQLLTELNDQGISISVDQEDLVINYDGDEMPEVTLSEIRRNKKDLVAYLKKYAAQSDFMDIQPAPVQDSYPLSSAQKRIWILSQYPEISKAYIIPSQVALSSSIDIDIFRRAVEAVVDRHEILRTVFKENQDGEVRQWVLSRTEMNFAIDYLDYSQLENSEQLINKYAEEDGFREFDLENGPLLRACIIKLSKDAYCFYYVMHHIISDGWSLTVLANDALRYYEAFKDSTG